jgi:3',5'-cyclic AMP phosphodiesterase CpdA
LWAISDLHTGHTGNKPVTESIHPSTPDDWLIVAGDVAERTDEIHWALDLLRKRFAKVIWVPGNHELWTTNNDPMQIFGKARYDYLVNICDEMGIITPEHPFPVWNEEGGPATIVPMFLLYDYTFLPQGAATKAEGLAIARERNVVGTDEFLLSSEPYATRDAWCRDRVTHTRKRLEDLDWMTPTVLVNHFPLVREPCDAMFYPEFSLWCGTTATADWHTRYNAVCSVYGHLHIPRTTWYDGLRFEEASVGYHGDGRQKAISVAAPVCPPGSTRRDNFNEFGGHFEITPEMRDPPRRCNSDSGQAVMTIVATLLAGVSARRPLPWAGGPPACEGCPRAGAAEI